MVTIKEAAPMGTAPLAIRPMTTTCRRGWMRRRRSWTRGMTMTEERGNGKEVLEVYLVRAWVARLVGWWARLMPPSKNPGRHDSVAVVMSAFLIVVLRFLSGAMVVCVA